MAEFVPDDAEVGFWLEGVPYFHRDKGGREYFDVELNKKGHLQRAKKSIPLTDLRCDSDSRKYFSVPSGKIVIEKISRLEGRLYWGTETNPPGKLFGPKRPNTVVLGVVQPPSKLSLALAKAGGIKNLDISTLVCGVGIDLEGLISGGEEFSSLRSKNSPSFAALSQCSPYGRKIAKSLIKVAATRIFANPSQAFMEPIANSIDAYFPKRRIGKFGMGFFSMLYWIIPTQANDNPKARLEIENYSKGECYVAVITFDSKEQTFRLSVQSYPGCMVKTTGALIKLYPVRDSFDSIDMVRRFQFVQNIDLVDRLLTSSKSDTLVNPVLFRRYFQRKPAFFFEDYATGIPLRVLFSSLLVPSVSTKLIVGGGEREDVYRPSSVLSRQFSSRSEEASFVISVGDVIIWESSIESDERSKFVYEMEKDRPSSEWGKMKETYIPVVILSLPGSTRMPVSRDDFILDSGLRKKISDDFQTVLCPHFKNLSLLERLVKEYATFTASDENAEVMETAMENYRKSRGILVPGKYAESIYAKAFPGQEITGSEFYDTFLLEKWVNGAPRYEPGGVSGLIGLARRAFGAAPSLPSVGRWSGIEVIFYPGDSTSEVTFAGTNTFLFVPDYWLSLPDWTSRLETSFQGRRLWSPQSKEIDDFKAGLKVAKDLFGDLKELEIENAGQEELALMVAVMGSIKNKETYFDVQPWNYENAKEYMNMFYQKFPEQFYFIMTAWLTRLDKMQPEYDYGSSKPQLAGANPPIEYFDKITLDHPKQKQYFSQVLIWLCVNVNPKDTLILPDTLIIFYMLLVDSTNLIELAEDFVEYFLCAKIIEEIKFMAKEFKKKVEISPLIVKGLVRDIKPIKRTLLIHYEKLRDFWGNSIAMSPKNTLLSGIEDISYLTKKYALASSTILDDPLPISDLLSGKNIATFSVNDLIGTLFRTPYSGLDFYSKIGPGPQPKLQILSIAVNEATTKPYHEAVVTELFQNSVDAIRASGNPEDNNPVFFGVTFTDREVVFTIEDIVGMNEDQFFHVGVPFLSSKTPSELQTGEMGTGFFNVYRQASKVEIKTVKDGQILECLDIPIRDAEGRVTDITRTISTNHDPDEPSGTIIKLTISVASKEESLELSGKFITFIDLVTSKVPLDIQVILNHNKYPLFKGKLYVDNPYYQIFRTGGGVPGLFCTKGIPVGYLSNVLSPEENLNDFTGIVVNIKHQGYTPVHSRTKVNYSNSEVASFIPMAKFITTMESYDRGRNRLNHTLSKSPLSQVIPPKGYDWSYYGGPRTAYSMNFYAFENIGLTKKKGKEGPTAISFASLVIEIAEKYGDEVPGDKIANDISTLSGDAGDIIAKIRWMQKELFDMVIGNLATWFRPKNTRDHSSIPTTLQEKPLDAKIVKWMTVYIQEYTSFLRKHFPDAPKPPKIEVSVPKKMSMLGQYSPAENTVEIYVKKYLEPDGLSDLRKFKKAKDPNLVTMSLTSELFKTYFFDADAVLPHECEHFRRKNAHHSGGVHSAMELDLFGLKKQYTFPEATMRIRSKMIEDGFWERVQKAL